MAVDIGIDAINLPGIELASTTWVNETHPAVAAGNIGTVEIWSAVNLTGCKVGIFYLTGANRLKCRAAVAIGAVASGAKRTFPALTLAVQIGDYIGMFFDGGQIEFDFTGYTGLWKKMGDYCIINSEEDYNYDSTDTVSLGGYLDVVGWTGKISGVTDPAEIMGVPVANIAKVKGVA